jgi:hypothetical protein
VIGQSAGKSFAYILGVYLGDGCVTYTGSPIYLCFRLNTIDEDFANATAEALLVVCGRKPNVRCNPVKRGSNNYSITLRHQELCERLRADTRSKAHIPAYVWDWSLDEKRAFIAGLMDSEGYVAANNTNPTNRRYFMGFKCTSEWTPEFGRLLETIGVRLNKIMTEKPRKPHYKAPIRFTIKIQSWIDAGCYFNILRKQSKIEDWGSVGAYERRARNPRRLTSETTCQALSQAAE